MATTLLELLDFPDRDGIRQIILDQLLTVNLPITDWSSGAVVRTMFEVDAAVTLDLVDAITEMVYSGYLGTADEKGASGDWLTTLAHGWYGLDRFPAAVAYQTISLVCAPGYGPYNITAGTECLATDGSRYFVASGGSLSSGSPLTNIDAVAEGPGAARGLITSVVALPGVSVSGAAIKTLGVPLYGRDEERDASLLKRCNDRWPDLDATLTGDDRVVKWAKAASAEVTRTRLDVDTALGHEGAVILTLAGSGGAVSAGVPAIVQAYVDARAPITDLITVQNSHPETIIAGGTVTVSASLLTQAQQHADAQWLAYLGAAQIGDKVEVARLIQALMDSPGVTDFVGWTINGVPANFPLSDGTRVAVPSDPLHPLTNTLTWNAV